MDIALWFPTAIGSVNNNSIDNDYLKDYCLQLSENIPTGGDNWINQSVYNTEGSYSILDDEIFLPINTWVEEQINLYAKELKFKNHYTLKEGWFAVYYKGDSQEFHTHPGHTFSCVYFISAPPNSSSLVLLSPNEPDMINPSYIEWNKLNSQKCNYDAVTGRLLIFRSYVPHCVPPNVGSGPRIILSYNL